MKKKETKKLKWEIIGRTKHINPGKPCTYLAKTEVNTYVIDLMSNGTWRFNNCNLTTSIMELREYNVSGFKTAAAAKRVDQAYEDKYKCNFVPPFVMNEYKNQ